MLTLIFLVHLLVGESVTKSIIQAYVNLCNSSKDAATNLIKVLERSVNIVFMSLLCFKYFEVFLAVFDLSKSSLERSRSKFQLELILKQNLS